MNLKSLWIIASTSSEMLRKTKEKLRSFKCILVYHFLIVSIPFFLFYFFQGYVEE